MENQLSFTEENYLKAIFKIGFEREVSDVGTNEIAAHLAVKPATVNSMLKKLKDKEFVLYEKYGKISLTKRGEKTAIEVVRKHRLWETFLHDKLEFSWDEVHEVAEQLEHIKSKKLVDKLDKFLNYPEFDPHGDPIPTIKGEIKRHHKIKLSETVVGGEYKIAAVENKTNTIYESIVELGIALNDYIKILEFKKEENQFIIAHKNQTLKINKKLSESIYVV